MKWCKRFLCARILMTAGLSFATNIYQKSRIRIRWQTASRFHFCPRYCHNSIGKQFKNVTVTSISSQRQNLLGHRLKRIVSDESMYFMNAKVEVPHASTCFTWTMVISTSPEEVSTDMATCIITNIEMAVVCWNWQHGSRSGVHNTVNAALSHQI